MAHPGSFFFRYIPRLDHTHPSNRVVVCRSAHGSWQLLHQAFVKSILRHTSEGWIVGEFHV
jgi:hypothetical protein